MEVVVTTATISRAKLQSNHHHQQTNIQLFYRPGALPVTQPTMSKEKISHSIDLLTPSSPGVFQLCLWPLIAPGYIGEGCHPSHQPSDASTPTANPLYIINKNFSNKRNISTYQYISTLQCNAQIPHCSVIGCRVAKVQRSAISIVTPCYHSANQAAMT